LLGVARVRGMSCSGGSALLRWQQGVGSPTLCCALRALPTSAASACHTPASLGVGLYRHDTAYSAHVSTACRPTARSFLKRAPSKRPPLTRGTACDSGWPQGHGATSTKRKSRACPTWTPAPNTHARFATSRPRTRGGEQRKTERSRTPLGRREWAAPQGVTGPLAASPRPRSLGCGRAAGTPLRGRFAHGEGNGHT
jgi:hypothetical protein